MNDNHDSLADEAARLLGVLRSWARQEMPGSADVWGEVTDRIATGSAECRLCPVCQFLGLVRHARPEAFGHLLDAAESLAAAVRDAVDTHRREWPRRRVEHIDIG